MTSYTNVFGGSPVQPSDVSYRAISLTANTTLQWPFSFQDTANVTAHIMDVTPTANGYILTLPDATEASVGEDFLISNLAGSTYTFYIDTVNSDGESSTIVTVAEGAVYYLYLRDNTISEGEWGVTLFGQGTTAISSITLNTTTTNSTLTLNGGTSATISSAGTITINVTNDLNALSGFGTATGYAVRTSYNNSTGAVTWALRTFTNSDGNVSVTNPSGIEGGTIIDLSSDVKIASSFSVGNTATYTTLTNAALYATSTSTSNTLTLGNSNGPLFLAGGTTYGNLTLSTSIVATPGTAGNLTLGSSGMTGTTTLYGPSSSSLLMSGGNITVTPGTGGNFVTGSSTATTGGFTLYGNGTAGASAYISSGTNGQIRIKGNTDNSYINFADTTGTITISSDTYVNFNDSTVQGIDSLTATTIVNNQVMKAAGAFQGTSTIGNLTPINTYNIASISRDASLVGQYKVTFTTAIGTSSGNYYVVFGPTSNGGTTSGSAVIYLATNYSNYQTQNYFTIAMYALTSSGLTPSDDGYVEFAVFYNS